MVDLTSAFAVPRNYQKLLEFSFGNYGWLVPDEVREQALSALHELVFLRTQRDNAKNQAVTNKGE